jgi:hypothetical protein
MRLAPWLVVVAACGISVAACSGGTKSSSETGRAATPADARAAPADAAPTTWRGPNLYTLVDGDVTIAVVLRPPGGWQEDWTDAHEVVTSPAGGTMKVTIERSDAPSDSDEIRPGVFQHLGGATEVSYFHRREFPSGPRLVHCAVSLPDADAPLFSDLARQCDQLEMQYEPDPRVEWTIEVDPKKVSLAKTSTVTVRYTATNTAKEHVDAKAYSLEFWIDGAPSMELGMAFGNGGFSKVWTHLPPGDTVDDSRSGMELVDAPGDHVITLVHLGRELARATLKVTK